MKRVLPRPTLLALALAGALDAHAATPVMSVYLFEGAKPVEGIEVRIDGQPAGQAVPGGVQVQPAAGQRKVVLMRDGKEVLAFEVELRGRRAGAGVGGDVSRSRRRSTS